MKELLAYVAKSLVDNPEAVQVKEVDCDGEVILELRVASEDMGKVIGRNGRIAKEIRAIVRSLAQRKNTRVSVEIVD
ncbi:MAG: KH domain-containing protein [Candidatus Onthomonas sp.]